MSDQGRQKQDRPRARPHAGLILAFLALGFVLASCGKKPGHLDAPPDVTDDQFPQIYPDPATDPKP